ncbi:MAG: cytochrome c biogenesis protein ResB [Pseudomonadota bacterium]|nr:cytochrome c biogenesis protein ResB [Pseudomonadota bacterium]
MSITTTGIEIRAKSRPVRDIVELVSSMRFSISLLSVICIASVIGTVVKQHEPYGNYVNQFGPFWAEVFRSVDLYTVYGAWWFLLILAFLVASTSLCIARNAPKILGDLNNYKEHLREQGLQAFHLKGQRTLDEPPAAAAERIGALLRADGWKMKIDQRAGGGTMIAARRGAANKLGYIAAHSAIVLVCIGGLFDGDLIVKAQMLWQGKSAYAGGGMFRDVGAQHRLSPATPTFRANLLVPEGARSGTAVISLQDGVVLQELPFDVELKKFIVEYYETGMPKLFASEIVIHDHQTGEATAATVKVNEPAFHRGVAIYQSSFDDGGSAVKLRALPMTAGGKPFEVAGTIGGSTALTSGGSNATIEFTGLRVINVENLSGQAASSGADVRKVDLAASLQQHLGSGAKANKQRELHNVGPSISYKLRDAAGQAREFNNYMLPVELDGQRVFLVGSRDNPNENMRYLRIPADDADRIDGWVRLHAALLTPALREKAAERYVSLATPADKPEMAPQLKATASRALALFAGAEAAPPGAKTSAGLLAISDFIEGGVPEAERLRISEVLLRILNGSLFELLNLSRGNAGLAPLVPNEATQAFMTQAVLSLSDSFFYPAPVILELADFTQVQASVFQVTRAPGKTLVYLGAVLLIVGVFAMLYIRERRLWVWLAPAAPDGGAPAGTKVVTAMSTTRRTLDADADFERLKQAILKENR